MLTIEVDPTAATGSTLMDTASVAGQQGDPDPGNNTATLMTPVRGVSDLQLTATAQPAAVYVGQNITYTLNVSNNGLDDEPDAILACPLPPDVACSFGQLEPGPDAFAGSWAVDGRSGSARRWPDGPGYSRRHARGWCCRHAHDQLLGQR